MKNVSREKSIENVSTEKEKNIRKNVEKKVDFRVIKDWRRRICKNNLFPNCLVTKYNCKNNIVINVTMIKLESFP